MPGGIFPVAQTLRVPFMRRLPFTFGWMAKRPIPADVMASWIRGVCTDRRVRRDVAKYVRTSDNEGLQAAAAGLAQLRSSDARALGSRRPGDAPEHGRRLSEIIPGARLVEVDDSYTLMPLDRPDVVADHLAAFVAESQGRRSQPQ